MDNDNVFTEVALYLASLRHLQTVVLEFQQSGGMFDIITQFSEVSEKLCWLSRTDSTDFRSARHSRGSTLLAPLPRPPSFPVPSRRDQYEDLGWSLVPLWYPHQLHDNCTQLRRLDLRGPPKKQNHGLFDTDDIWPLEQPEVDDDTLLAARYRPDLITLVNNWT